MSLTQICKVTNCDEYRYNLSTDYCCKHRRAYLKYGSPDVYHRGVRGLAYKDHPLFSIWKGIKSRTSNENLLGYKYYGGRGIAMCEKWRNDFWSFVEDMGDRPTMGHSIDRIDNDGNYEPGNCRWATATQQVRNRRCSKSEYVRV